MQCRFSVILRENIPLLRLSTSSDCQVREDKSRRSIGGSELVFVDQAGKLAAFNCYNSKYGVELASSPNNSAGRSDFTVLESIPWWE